jgi:glutamate-1-semialdehyde 2,1-aminomutase
VLIFDEVKTGFRIAKGGAQQYFNVTADLVTYAKALGNGFPIAAIGGKKDIMEGLLHADIVQGGTYTGNAVATAAACATLDEIEKGALEKVQVHGERLKAGIGRILHERGIPGLVQGPAAMPAVVLSETENISEFRDMAQADNSTYRKIIWKLLKKGVMPDTGVHEPWFISASHTDNDADFAIGAFEEALREVIG